MGDVNVGSFSSIFIVSNNKCLMICCSMNSRKVSLIWTVDRYLTKIEPVPKLGMVFHWKHIIKFITLNHCDDSPTGNVADMKKKNENTKNGTPHSRKKSWIACEVIDINYRYFWTILLISNPNWISICVVDITNSTVYFHIYIFGCHCIWLNQPKFIRNFMCRSKYDYFVCWSFSVLEVLPFENKTQSQITCINFHFR